MRTLKNKKAFTLVEVMLAVGVVSVAIAAMIGLLASITGNVAKIKYQNRAISLVSDIESTVKLKTFDEVFKWVEDPSAPYVIYFWDEYQNPEDPDNSSLTTKSSEMPGAVPQNPPSKEAIRNSEGEIYRVLITLYQGALKGEKTKISMPTFVYSAGPLGGDSTDYALSGLPLNIEIYVDPRDEVITGPGDAEINDQRKVYDEGYIMKMR